MSEPLTQVDLRNLSDGIANSSIDWDRFATARGYANRKSAQKAMRRASKKLPPPTPTPSRTTTKATSKRKNTRPKKEGGRANKSSGPVKTLQKGKEGKRGLAREGAGEGRVEGTGEGVAQGAGEGIGQRMGQGSDKFVQGRPFNEKIDRDFRPDRREFLGDGETSEEEDDDDDDEDEESEKIRWRDNGH
ncbi:hypothetical protein KC331_g5053 [Hortaea werneckii]|nr:hypothetical protein KC331_g5053 [Hortaea werneckii]KAI7717195.1 hypothetical protein KC353_g4768 [Hortaea werneckii]